MAENPGRRHQGAPRRGRRVPGVILTVADILDSGTLIVFTEAFNAGDGEKCLSRRGDYRVVVRKVHDHGARISERYEGLEVGEKLDLVKLTGAWP